MNRMEQFAGLAKLSAVCTVVASIAVFAQESKPPAISPVDLVRATVNNEVAAGNNTAIKFMFRSRKHTSKGDQKKIYVEGNEALASMTISENDHPLTPDQERTEMEKLQQLAHDPSRLHKEYEHERQEVDHTLRIMKALPDAFCFEYAGTEEGDATLGKAGDELVRLKFTPNPSFVPPSRIEQVLEGMEGYLVIDTNAKRIARMDGTLFKEVTFGWGIFGRLDQGGHFLVQQADAGDGNWAITEMNLKITGKILLIKSLNLVSDEVFSDFHRLPDDVPFARAVELLQNEQVKLAQNNHTAPTTEASINTR
jgi:hypothetical protein